MTLEELLDELNGAGIVITDENLVLSVLTIFGYTLDAKVISPTELEAYKDANLILDCLREAGVDNWDGYSDAMEYYRNVKGEE